MRYSVEKSGTPAELTHFGVKGMKWGVRKAYSDRIQTNVARNRGAVDRVKSGNATKTDKLLVGKNTKLATKRNDDLEAHAKRIAAGKAYTHDLLQMYGNLLAGAALVDVPKGISLARKA